MLPVMISSRNVSLLSLEAAYISHVFYPCSSHLVLLEMRLVVKRLRTLGAFERLLPRVAPMDGMNE